MPAVSSAHQEVVIYKPGTSEATLTIFGDHTKTSDLITIDYDSIKDEYIIGHDIEDPIPIGCYRDAVEPFHKLHCPRSLAKNIRIHTGAGKDSIKVGFDTVGFPGDLFRIEADCEGDNDEFDGGPEEDVVDLGEGDNQAVTGTGNDQVASGPGADNISTGATASASALPARAVFACRRWERLDFQRWGRRQGDDRRRQRHGQQRRGQRQGDDERRRRHRCERYRQRRSLDRRRQ